MTTNNNNLVTSPVGKILYMAIALPQKNKFKNDAEEYSVKLLFDGNTAEGLAFKQRVLDINSAKVVTTSKTIDLKDGEYIVNFISKPLRDETGKIVRRPTVFDQEGNELKGMDIKFFNAKKDSGNAKITGIHYTKGPQDTILLSSVTLSNMEYGLDSADLPELEGAIKEEHNKIVNAR
jgi:hypothetical protein